MPDYIPAGTYSKLQSEGFDLSPNSKLNIVFMNDYNASLFDNNIENMPLKIKSSSSSKAWLVWLIVIIILLIIVGIVITIFILKRKGKNKNTIEVNISNNNDKEKVDQASNVISHDNINI